MKLQYLVSTPPLPMMINYSGLSPEHQDCKKLQGDYNGQSNLKNIVIMGLVNSQLGAFIKTILPVILFHPTIMPLIKNVLAILFSIARLAICMAVDNLF